jgi:hypothetical protein
MSNMRIVRTDSTGKDISLTPTFYPCPLEDKSKGSASALEQYATRAFDRRQSVVYHPSPQLHKSVYSARVGMEANCYSPLHDIMRRLSYLSLDAMEDLYKAAIETEFVHDEKDIETFLHDCRQPGTSAASHGQVRRTDT